MCKANLAFRYSADQVDFVDAEEYRKLLASGSLSPRDAAYLRQFLSEWYGKPTSKQLRIHGKNHLKELNNRANASRRDVTAGRQPDFAPAKAKVSADRYYTPVDYGSKIVSTPEDVIIALEEFNSQPSDNVSELKKETHE